MNEKNQPSLWVILLKPKTKCRNDFIFKVRIKHNQHIQHHQYKESSFPLMNCQSLDFLYVVQNVFIPSFEIQLEMHQRNEKGNMET